MWLSGSGAVQACTVFKDLTSRIAGMATLFSSELREAKFQAAWLGMFALEKDVT